MLKCKFLASLDHPRICLFLYINQGHFFWSQNTSLTNYACIQHINKFTNKFHYNDHVVLQNVYCQNYRVPTYSFLTIVE